MEKPYRQRIAVLYMDAAVADETGCYPRQVVNISPAGLQVDNIQARIDDDAASLTISLTLAQEDSIRPQAMPR